MPKLSLLFLLALALIGLTEPAMASSGGSGLPWETPLQTLTDSIKGPVAFAVSLMGLLGGGAMLIWGGEINEFLRRIVYLVLVIALLVFASNIMSSLFSGSSAALVS